MVEEQEMSSNQRECQEEELKMALMKHFKVDELSQSECQRVTEA